ncbi:MAG TPA: efflux transporter outer membrane subunit [Noviherbaspirillum sp.]|nr:efflux transporter outer membrane subunit [Noviherbaspirillum sp.]
MRAALTLLAAAVLSACSLAPKHELPPSPVATAYPVQTAAAQAPAGWRDFFAEPRLQALIGSALEHNRDLRIAALRIEEARALYRVQSADLLPSVGVAASAGRGRTSADLSPTGSARTAGNYQVGLSLTAFELDFFGRVRNLNQAALAQYLATEEARNAAQIALVAEVARAYLSERAFAEQQALAQRTLQSRAEGLDLARQRFEAGATSALDLRQNETLYHSARVAVATLARQRAQAENALTLLVGQPLAGLPAPQSLAAFDIATGIPAGLPSDLLTLRPDIRSAEQRLVAANANIGAARAAFFPRISLTAGIGTASTALSGLFEAGTGTWSFVPQLLMPIFDAGRNTANLDLAGTRKHVAVAEYERSIQAAFREVADALVARETLEEQVAAQQAVLESQSVRLRLADERYRAGVASSLDLLDAQREVFQAEQALVQARLARLTNAVDLYRALGGGLKESGG